MEKSYHVRIDRATQGPEGHEQPADRFSIDSEDFLWIYVEAELPLGSHLAGDYIRLINSEPESANRIPLDPPKLVDGQYRFSVIHYVLSPRATYMFRFADNLADPRYQDQWEIVTVGGKVPTRGTEGNAIKPDIQTLLQNGISGSVVLDGTLHILAIPNQVIARITTEPRIPPIPIQLELSPGLLFIRRM